MRIAYREGQTAFHRLDPLTKLSWCLVATIWLFSVRELRDVLILSATFLVVAIVGAGLDPVGYVKTTLVLLVGGASLALFQGFFRPGPGIDLAGVHLSYDGMELGAALTLRTFGLVASSLAFSGTTSPRQLGLAMQRIGVPYRYAHVAYLALRFIPLLEADLRLIDDAQRLRRVTNGRQKLVKTIVALLAVELRRADSMAIALETRGFGRSARRTELERVTIQKSGVALVLATVVLMCIYFLALRS